jgi:autotransporter-associated beta strand protein
LNVLAAVTANTNLQGGGANRTLTIGSAGIVRNGPGVLNIGSGTANQNVNLVLAGNQSIANNGTANININNTVAGTGSPTFTNNGTGTGYVGMGTLLSTVGRMVQDSATSTLGLRAANNSGFAGHVDVLQGTVLIGTSPNNLGSAAGQVNLGGTGSAAATIEINDNSSQTYVAKPIVLGTTLGTLTIRLRDDSGTNTHTIQGAISGTNNLTLENQGGDDKLTFTTGGINNAGTITHIGTGAGDLTISSMIGSNVTGVIQNSATSRMVLEGFNSHSGDTTVSAGTLVVTGNAIPDTGKLVIDGGRVDPSGFTEVIGTLFFGAAQQAAGTWGATGSGAANIDDTRFTGSGVVSVASGPGSGFAAWQTANNTAGGLNGDHDNDGVANGLEWFLGGNTNTTGFTPQPAITNLSVTWVRHPGYPGNYGIGFRVETSPNLANPWTPVTLGVGACFVEITGNNVIYTFPPGPVRNFARLVIIGP